MRNGIEGAVGIAGIILGFATGSELIEIVVNTAIFSVDVGVELNK